MKVMARFFNGKSNTWEMIDLSECFDIIFGDGPIAPGSVKVSQRDGWLELSTTTECLEMQPRAANLARVRAAKE
jgi:hypothetical protein